MTDTTRVVLLALGIALLVVVLLPLLVMTGMMGAMAGGGMIGRWGPSLVVGLVLLILAVGAVLLAANLRGRR